MKKNLHIGRPNVGDRSLFNSLVDEMFERRWFSNNGQLVQELESRLAAYLRVKHCVAVCNATVGLQIACHALSLSGEVILPSFTFVATAHALEWEQLTPVFADVDPKTHLISPASIADRITSKTSAILGVHLWGQPCDTAAIDALARKHSLHAFYDAAHAFACHHEGQPIGNFGNCEVFSFHATKFFNTFEGGAITTNDDALAKRIRLMKNFGFAGSDKVTHLGTNGKMPEVCAAMGLANLECLPQFLETNRRHHELYSNLLAETPGVRVLSYPDAQPHNRQYVVIEVAEEEFGKTRDQLLHSLQDLGVYARRYFFPGCHRMEPYASKYTIANRELPVTESLCHRVLLLPNGTAVTGADVEFICNHINCV